MSVLVRNVGFLEKNYDCFVRFLFNTLSEEDKEFISNKMKEILYEQRRRMRQRAIRLLRRGQPIYFFLRSMADALANVNKYIRNLSKSLERL